MAKFVFVLGLFATVLVADVAGGGMTAEKFGMEMSVRAYSSVCWYVNLKIFPYTHVKDFNKCSGQAKFQMDHILNDKFFQDYPDQRQQYFGKWMRDHTMGKLAREFRICDDFLKEPNATPKSDESDALNDSSSGNTNSYPFKAFAYCLMSTLRQNYGNQSIEAVKNEKTQTRKNWMQAILDRENEFRARHSVAPLELVKDLVDAAQTWAETNAKACNMYHSANSDSGRQFQGQGTGESLSAGGGGDDNEIAAYQAADGWYEEIKYYPYPDGYQSNDDALFEKIGHFTQSVWKNTKYVGYGYAFNPNCKPYNRYIAARYYPAGNVDGSFPQNVNPPKNSS